MWNNGYISNISKYSGLTALDAESKASESQTRSMTSLHGIDETRLNPYSRYVGSTAKEALCFGAFISAALK